ncbi:MAG TPA: 4-hydroxy-tetrahydrodipicolinate reductase [Lentisphaeria bacterium]|nr:MAG: 4-hydroxy-tetrahydrodipicolinate reductase [Lentisphaerae bacterium GWF2_50_93]HCE42913.1 4-hydroxy-tetrahydrodipicolinate reductase [Lentisphaeria bacterium]
MKVVVVGAAGRMGRLLVSRILTSNDMKLAGATEFSGSPFVGKDAGMIAGLDACGIEIGTDIKPLLRNADAVIDFSTGPVVENAKLATDAGACMVIGTTALTDADKKTLSDLTGKKGGRIVMASNMSVGVNLLFDLCAKVAKILGDDYDVEIVEMHHNKKKDAPSGTAVSLAEAIAKARDLSYEKNAVHGRKGIIGERKKSEIGIHAVRGGDVVGDHTVIFATEGERIELVHKASSRDTFAKGALKAVRFLSKARPGIYNMQDVLGLK